MKEAISSQDQKDARGPRDRADAAERSAVYLRVLSEASRELAGLHQPAKLAESFLLTLMGTFGITKGWVGIYKSGTREPSFTVCRGIQGRDAASVEEGLHRAAALNFADRTASGAGHPVIVSLAGESGMEAAMAGDGWENLITWSMGESFLGAIALGSRLSGAPLNPEELGILEHFTNVFAGALSQILSLTNIQMLNADLERKNLGLQHALETAARTRGDLDRKIHQLKTLSDLTAELSSIIHMDELLQTYLLVSMGAVGVGDACLLLHDRETGRVRTVVRGSAVLKAMDGGDAERLLYRCLGSSAKRGLTPMTVTRIPSLEVLAEENLGMVPAVGVLFVVDPSLLGMVCFGARLSGQPISDEDAALFESLTSNFLAFLKNARSFQTIELLNEDLAARNEDLTQTIKELREARFTIALLEKAKTHLKGVVDREIERLGTARPIDFVLIFALATFLGLLFNYTSPQSLPLLPEFWRRPPVQTVSGSEARRLVEEGKAVLVDARPKELHDQRHIEGAINVPPALFDLVYMMKMAKLPSDTAIIVYGRTVSRRYDEDVAHRLKRRDHDIVRVLDGGIEDWERGSKRSGP